MSAPACTGGTAALRNRQRVQGRPKIRAASFDDYPQIAALQIRNGISTRPFEDWKAIWSTNPVFQDRAHEWPIGWVLQAEKGEVVGSIGNVPFAYRFRGRDLVAAAACAWAVDANYRPWALSLLNQLTGQAEVDFFVTTTVGPSSEPCLTFLEWSKVPVGMWQKTAFWITNYRAFVSIALHSGSLPVSTALRYRPSLASLRRLLHSHAAPEETSAYTIELRHEFDNRFAEFWQELSRQNENLVLAARSQRALAWHFRFLLQQHRIWILTACEGSRLVAYGIFERHDNSSRGLKHVRFVDFQALNGFEAALPPILNRALERCRSDGAHVLECTGYWLDRPSLPRVAPPYSRALPAWLYYYKAGSAELRDLLTHSEVWAPSDFDGDACL
jgi:hypothetical protein